MSLISCSRLQVSESEKTHSLTLVFIRLENIATVVDTKETPFCCKHRIVHDRLDQPTRLYLNVGSSSLWLWPKTRILAAATALLLFWYKSISSVAKNGNILEHQDSFSGTYIARFYLSTILKWPSIRVWIFGYLQHGYHSFINIFLSFLSIFIFTSKRL